MAEMRNWSDLLQQSQQQLAEISGGDGPPRFPAIQRNLEQLEKMSMQLKGRAAATATAGAGAVAENASKEVFAATRLLARQGVDAEQLADDLGQFKLRATIEDVVPLEAFTPEEYCHQVREAIMLTVLQTAQQATVDAFDDQMMSLMQEEWQQERKEFLFRLSQSATAMDETFPATTPFSALSRYPVAGGSAVAAAAGGGGVWQAATPYGGTSPRVDASPAGWTRQALDPREGLLSSSATIAAAETQEMREAAYLSVIEKMNEAKERGRLLQTAAKMKDAISQALANTTLASTSLKTVSLLRIWRLVQGLVEASGTGTAGEEACVMAMVRAARFHLEEVHSQFMTEAITRHSSSAFLGGAPDRLQRVQAYVRVLLHGDGVPDFDGVRGSRQATTVDTIWQQIFYCLRSGFYDEACRVASLSPSTRAYGIQLAEWLDRDKDGLLSSAAAASAMAEYERALHQWERRGRPLQDRHRLLLLALLTGSGQLAERAHQDVPGLLVTIEDFLWFRLCIVHRHHREDVGGGAGGRRAAAAAMAGQRMQRPGENSEAMALASIQDLQAYLRSFPPSFYHKDYADPLLYTYVLLLSLQFHEAVTYLTHDPGAGAFWLDAVHIAIVLVEGGAMAAALTMQQKGATGQGMSGMSIGMPATIGADVWKETSKLVRDYGRTFVRRQNVAAALEYFSASAMVEGAAAAAAAVATSSALALPDLQRVRLERERQVMREMLREVMTAPGGIRVLLLLPARAAAGAGGLSLEAGDNLLQRFLPEKEKQNELILDAARECRDVGKLPEAIELFIRIGAHVDALALVNGQFASEIALVAAGQPEGEVRAREMQAAGNDVLDNARLLSSAVAGDLGEEKGTFLMLEAILRFFLFTRAGQVGEALRELKLLPFFPADGRSPDVCAAAMRSLRQEVEDLVPPLLEAAMAALSSYVLVQTEGEASTRALKEKILMLIATASHRQWPTQLINEAAKMSMSSTRSTR